MDICDGCRTEAGVCVPLSQTSRTQCGRGGAACVNGDVGYCPMGTNGICSTGFECFIHRPAVCECGSQGEGWCGFDCGTCPGGVTCVDFRCAPLDAGAGDAGTDDAGVRDGG